MPKEQAVIDSLVLDLNKAINKDCIKSFILKLQNFKTRYCLNSNRDSIAAWIANKFIEFGFTDVLIDSFYISDSYLKDTLNYLQKNIVATIVGTVNPQDVIILGAHYDSISNLPEKAPGADDNASGIASLLEIARIIKMKNYNPSTTIRFVTFAAEELGVAGTHGNNHYAQIVHNAGDNIKLMINIDMVLNSNKKNKQKIKIKHYPGFEYYRDFAARVSEYFTGLVSIDDNYWGGSDSDAFYDLGYPAIYFEEAERSKYYHTENDLLENYNGTEYCSEVTKAILANLIVTSEIQNGLKAPYRLIAIPGTNQITLNWKRNNETNILGYNIYRKEDVESTFNKLNSFPVTDTFFVDMTVKNIPYYYSVSSLDISMNESRYNFQVKSRAVTLDQGILLIDETKDGTGAKLNPTDEQVDTFFASILKNFSKKDFDIAKEGNITLADMGAFSTVFWQANDANNILKSSTLREDIKNYLSYGGKIIFNGYYPSKVLDSNTVYPHNYTNGDFLYDVMKIKGVNWKYSSKFYGANSNSLYPSIFVDTLKTKKSLKYHLSDIESIEAAPEAEEIYFYNTQYDSATVQGSMKGMPVGIEYLGDDYKLVVLSFPLYYMNQEEAKELVRNILLNKFNEVTEVKDKKEELIPTEYCAYQNYPNPFNPSTRIKYFLPQESYVELKIYDVMGREVKSLLSDIRKSGNQEVVWYGKNNNGEQVSSEVYFYKFRANSLNDTNSFERTVKLVMLK